jgi:hypothetical protein
MNASVRPVRLAPPERARSRLGVPRSLLSRAALATDYVDGASRCVGAENAPCVLSPPSLPR